MYQSTLLTLQSSSFNDIPVSILRDVDLAWGAGGLGAWCEVHGVAEEAVAGHAVSYHPRHHLTTVDTDRDPLSNKSYISYK